MRRLLQARAGAPGTSDAVSQAVLALAAGIDHHATVPSTQPLAAASARPWTVVSTDHQTAGRGRLGRDWENPPGSGLAFSVVLPLIGVDAGSPPSVVGAALAASRVREVGQVPLCVGAAVHEALCDLGVRTGVKWPNDVLSVVTGRKLAGILCQVADSGQAVVAGIGLNVWEASGRLTAAQGRYGAVEHELPAAPEDLREQVLAAVLHRLAVWHTAWWQEGAYPAQEHDVPGLVQRLTAVSLTVGQEVDLHLPDGSTVRGRATGIAESGGILVRPRTSNAGSADGPVTGVEDGILGPVREFRAADVVHLRPAV